MPIIGAVLMPFFNVVNTVVLGGMGDPNLLAGYALGSLTLAILLISTLVQLSSLETVVGQANGAKDYRLARIYLHRQYVITFVGCLLFLVPIIFVKDILLAIGMEPTIVDIAATYIFYCTPGAFFNAFAYQNIFYCN